MFLVCPLPVRVVDCVPGRLFSYDRTPRCFFGAVARAPVPVPKYSNPKLPPNPLFWILFRVFLEEIFARVVDSQQSYPAAQGSGWHDTTNWRPQHHLLTTSLL